MNQIVKSSRKLSLLELLKILQYEYLCCDIRIITYVNEKHRDYWAKIASFKKEKIINIAKKKEVESIFSDERLMNNMKSTIYAGFGLPAFMYKDEADRERQEKWDVLNFFYKNNKVTAHTTKGKFEAIIIYVDVLKKSIIVDIKGEDVIIEFEQISRSLW